MCASIVTHHIFNLTFISVDAAGRGRFFLGCIVTIQSYPTCTSIIATLNRPRTVTTICHLLVTTFSLTVRVPCRRQQWKRMVGENMTRSTGGRRDDGFNKYLWYGTTTTTMSKSLFTLVRHLLMGRKKVACVNII